MIQYVESDLKSQTVESPGVTIHYQYVSCPKCNNEIPHASIMKAVAVFDPIVFEPVAGT